MEMTEGLVIIGAGQAGLQLAASLRERGYEEPIVLVGEEAVPPYQRPPLSKTFLTGETAAASLFLRSPSFYDSHHLTLLTDERAIGIDRTARRIALASGRRLAFRKLALTTGAAARIPPLPGIDRPGVAALRTLADAEMLRTNLQKATEIVIIGGGFIGLETAAAARKLGKSVTVLEALPRLLARVVAPIVSDFYAEAHRRRGIAVRTNVTVAALEGDASGIRAVRLADGTRIAADLVILGTGALPRTELAEALGLACQGGILVDRFARTSCFEVVAAGDCTVHRDLDGRMARLESVENAIDQAKVAAATILGLSEPFSVVPWFWSDQGDLKLQIAGYNGGYDRIVLRGDPATESFSVLYYRRDQLLAVDSINRPADYAAARRLLAARVHVPLAEAADASVPLKKWLAQRSVSP
jgi:3-phenylpropionate/trans-cinnamate dioxygenase ferredoxin reductase subunit